jgi:hypothetical protein
MQDASILTCESFRVYPVYPISSLRHHKGINLGYTFVVHLGTPGTPCTPYSRSVLNAIPHGDAAEALTASEVTGGGMDEIAVSLASSHRHPRLIISRGNGFASSAGDADLFGDVGRLPMPFAPIELWGGEGAIPPQR